MTYRQLVFRNVFRSEHSFFSKNLFAQGIGEMNFHLVSRLRDDANLMYLSQAQRTGKKGRPKLYDGKIKFFDLDHTRMETAPPPPPSPLHTV